MGLRGKVALVSGIGHVIARAVAADEPGGPDILVNHAGVAQ